MSTTCGNSTASKANPNAESRDDMEKLTYHNRSIVWHLHAYTVAARSALRRLTPETREYLENPSRVQLFCQEVDSIIHEAKADDADLIEWARTAPRATNGHPLKL
jgi:hypothetical protein